MDRPKRILLIGCGEYARKAHLPVLHEYKDKVSVVAVLVGKGDVDYVTTALAEFELDNLPVLEVRSITDTLDKLREIIDHDKQLDGAIVSSVSAFNFHIAHRCLLAGMHVLVEKPATCPFDCSWKGSRAARILPQMNVLAERSQRNGLRLLIGAQRRYETVYETVREQLTGRPLEIIQVCHALGWPKRPKDLVDPSWRYNPKYTGGKIMHSGYHVIDIVMWLLKHTNPAITRAKVFCSFERGRFSNFLLGSENHNVEKTAALSVQFFENDPSVPTAIANILMTLATPEQSIRETYFFVTRDKTRLTIERDSPRPSNDTPVVRMQRNDSREFEGIELAGATPGNQMPTRDFLDGLLHGPPPEERSLAADHLRSAQIVQAAYLSAIHGRVEELSVV